MEIMVSYLLMFCFTMLILPLMLVQNEPNYSLKKFDALIYLLEFNCTIHKLDLFCLY